MSKQQTKAEALKTHKVTKAEKQAGLKLSKKAADAVMAENETTAQGEPVSKLKEKTDTAAPKQLSATEQAGNAYYANVTVKKFKSARKEVAVPAFVAGAEYERQVAIKVITALKDAIENGKSYSEPILKANKYLNS